MHPYERLLVWQRAHALAVGIYGVTATWADPSVRIQLRRASQSVAANIVEGAAGQSPAQFARFLGIVLGSAYEVEYHLRFAADVGLLGDDDHSRLRSEATEIKRMLVGLHRTVRKRATLTPRS